MTPFHADDLRSRILDAVVQLADLDRRPSVLTRVRDLIRESTVVPDTAIDVLTGALHEAGVAATQVARDLSHSSGGDLQFITVFESSVVLVVKNDGSSVTVEDMTTNETRTLKANELPQRGDKLLGIEVLGSFRSFMSSDETLPKVRGDAQREHAKHHGHDAHHIHRLRDLVPYARRLFRSERKDILVILGYSVISSILGLVVPLSSSAIVNAVALGVFNQQLIVLCLIVLAAMIILAVFAVIERYIIDMVQRRLFVRTTFDIMYRLPIMKQSAHRETYAPELVNRFFDVMTIQKSLGKFLLEGTNAVLVLLTGLILVGIYHPFFLLYDVAFLIFLPLLTLVLGRGAVPTSIKVSKKKYEAAAWLEDVARNHMGFKLTGAHDFAYSRIDAIATGYVEARHKHFLILARQILGSMLFKAGAMVGILALGGILVIQQAISLGQLVAAELVIITILGAIEKLINQFDLYYDMVAGIDKLSMIAEQPLEEVGGRQVPSVQGPGAVRLDHVVLDIAGQTILRGVSLDIARGSHVSIVGESGAGKSTLLQALVGLYDTYHGNVTVNGVDIRDADLRSLRSRIGLVFPENQLVAGTIRDNITLGRPLSDADLSWALSITFLDRDIRELEHGMMTHVIATGENLAYGLRRRILFARMIVHKPEILLIDEAFDGIEDSVKLAMLDALFTYPGWTIVNVSHDPEVVRRTDRVVVLKDGRVVQDGPTRTLCTVSQGPFAALFPDPRPFLGDEPQKGGIDG